MMRAAYATSFDRDDPLSGLVIGERPDPEAAPDGWTRIAVRATSLNHHDLWTLRGVGITEDQLPMILGCDAAGVDDSGAEVVVHSVINAPGWSGDETLDPRRSLLSEKYQGTLAEYVVVPSANVVPKPADLSFAEASCLPTAWLTAYRMLFVRGGLVPGQSVLVQGASGGVATACIALARAAGLTVYATGRTEAKQEVATRLGAHQAFPPGARLPERVDAVLDSIGEAVWAHSLKALKPGGKLVTCGATSGTNPPAELNRIFFLQLQVIGSTMGTKAELAQLMAFLATSGVRPTIDRTLPLDSVRDGLAAMESGTLAGKIVIEL